MTQQQRERPTVQDVVQAFEAALYRFVADGLDADTAREGLAVCAGRVLASMEPDEGVTREQLWEEFLTAARREEALALRLLGEVVRPETVQ